MSPRSCKRLTALLLALLLCVSLPSCSLVSAFKGAISDLTDQPSDFDRYIEYLRGLNEDHEDIYDGYGYMAFAYPVQVQDETCLNLAGVMNAKGGNVDKYFTLTVVMIIPEGGQGIYYLFDFAEDQDGEKSVIVQGKGTINASEYNGSLPVFEEYTNNASDNADSEDHYREMATEEFNRLLAAAEILLSRADLTLDALGFTYTPDDIETNQTVSSHTLPTVRSFDPTVHLRVTRKGLETS